MDTQQSILKLVTPGCYMATIDLKDNNNNNNNNNNLLQLYSAIYITL